MNNEKELNVHLKKLFQDASTKFFWRRVENILEPGMPDVYAVVDEKAFWLELKVMKIKNENPVLSTCLTINQVNFLSQNKRAGGNSVLAISFINGNVLFVTSEPSFTQIYNKITLFDLIESGNYALYLYKVQKKKEKIKKIKDFIKNFLT